VKKLILEEWISLDGYVSDQNGKLDFFPSSEGNRDSDQDQLKFLDSIDTILLGRVTYELFVDFWPTATTDKEIIADKLNSIPKIVFSKKLKRAPWGKWHEATVISGNAAEYVRDLKQKSGKNIVLWGSIALSQSLMKENLVDEYHLQVCPTTTGGGRPLFTGSDTYKRFSLVDIAATTQVWCTCTMSRKNDSNFERFCSITIRHTPVKSVNNKLIYNGQLFEQHPKCSASTPAFSSE
jgi:dihydrofolate reductase